MVIENTIAILKGKKSKFASVPYIILALFISTIISMVVYYYYNKNKTENKSIKESIIAFFITFIFINMLTRDAGISL